MKDITVIAFDADDTLWVNEPFFQEVEQQYITLLSNYATSDQLSIELFHTEMSNLERFSYGAKGFTLSMIETAISISQNNRYRLIVATKGDLLDQQRKLQRSDLSPYFDHIEAMSDKTEEEYAKLLSSLHVLPEQFLMVGNSLKSDIQSVLAIGGYGAHIPFEVMWKHEVVSPFEHPRLIHINWITELSSLSCQ